MCGKKLVLTAFKKVIKLTAFWKVIKAKERTVQLRLI